MQSNIKYSVIIPVYNAEKTIERCLDSLLKQNREDVELIVINDGSSDKSDEIIRNYVKEHTNIVYVSQKNSGVSRARNNGLELAKGEYVSFVDSDDYVVEEYFQNMDMMTISQDIDMWVFAYCLDNAEKITSSIYENLEKSQDQNYILSNLLASRIIMSPINKLFKLKLIREKNLSFNEKLHTGEDFNFCLAYAVTCKKINVKNKILYMVDVSDDTSLSRKYRTHLDKIMTDVFRVATKTISDSKIENRDELLDILDYLYVKNVFSCIAEEFKVGKTGYIKNCKEIKGIAKSFESRLDRKKSYCNMIHLIIRVLLKFKIIYPIYMITYLVKARR